MLAGCEGPANASANRTFQGQPPVQVIATVGMVADIVRNVGGDRIAVTQLMGAGVDPHLYKATRDDVRAILAADCVFYAGLMLEGKMSDALVKVANQKPVFAVTERIDPSYLIHPEGAAGHADPHVWMDVSAWSQCVAAVADALAAFDPACAEQYQRNAAVYQRRLADLHGYGQRVLATIPDQSRVLITSHDAFNYFGKAYGLRVEGVQGLSTESEAGLARVNELVDLLVENKVEAVFVETSVPRKNIQALMDGAASRGQTVRIGGELFSDAMGAEGTYEGTYVGMLDHNITTVARALGGVVPPGGFGGKLGAAGREDE